MDDKILREVRPSWWNFFWHILFFWLLFIPPAVALWRRASLLFTVHPDRITVRTGVLSRTVKETFITDIRTIDARQGFLQRLMGIGDLVIDTSGSDDEITVRGLPDPLGVKDLILSLRRGTKPSAD
jgi:membrane protein YdbS with pleckstrin-like domain